MKLADFNDSSVPDALSSGCGQLQETAPCTGRLPPNAIKLNLYYNPPSLLGWEKALYLYSNI